MARPRVIKRAHFDSRAWQIGWDKSLLLGRNAVVMGVLNTTPDSFSDGGDFLETDAAVARAHEMIRQGVHIIDVGGESTKPGAEPVNGEVERRRILPIIKHLAGDPDCIISVDTYRAETAQAAVEAGAHIINDVWGCQKDPDIAQVAASTGAGLVVMNTRRERDVGKNLIDDARAFLKQSLKITRKAGVDASQIVLDPGFGFAKTMDHDVPILNNLEGLHSLGFPLLVGTSRKRFLGAITGRDAPERGVATAATSVIARLKGAAIFRVHDIAANKDALAVADALIANSCGWEENG